MLNSKKQRETVSINAGSMADIAFLLLIFFLVTTTIDTDKGIVTKLPPWAPMDEPVKINQDNIFTIKVNAKDEILAEGELITANELRPRTIAFITNPLGKSDLPKNPQSAIISLQNDRSTSYKTYLQVYGELKGAYTDIRDTEAQKRFGKAFEDLGKNDRRSIINKYPMVISEAEPTEYE